MDVGKLIHVNKHDLAKREIIHKAAISGELSAYILHPITKEAIKVHPETVRRLKAGEVLTVKDVLSKGWH